MSNSEEPRSTTIVGELIGRQSLVHRYPAMMLILLGFMTVYFIGGLRGSPDPSGRVPTTAYLGIGFGFFLALAGVVLLFFQLRDSAAHADAAELPPSTSDLEHAIGQLNKNYEIQRRQATQGFILAGVFAALGICVILAGSVGELFGFTASGGRLTVVAGIVVEAISGLGLYLYQQTSRRLNITSDRLHQSWKVLSAFRRADALPEDRRADMLVRLIELLVEQDRQTVEVKEMVLAPKRVEEPVADRPSS